MGGWQKVTWLDKVLECQCREDSSGPKSCSRRPIMRRSRWSIRSRGRSPSLVTSVLSAPFSNSSLSPHVTHIITSTKNILEKSTVGKMQITKYRDGRTAAYFVISTSPQAQAVCSGVHESESRLLRSAPWAISSLRASTLPSSTATCTGAMPTIYKYMYTLSSWQITQLCSYHWHHRLPPLSSSALPSHF